MQLKVLYNKNSIRTTDKTFIHLDVIDIRYQLQRHLSSLICNGMRGHLAHIHGLQEALWIILSNPVIIFKYICAVMFLSI